MTAHPTDEATPARKLIFQTDIPAPETDKMVALVREHANDLDPRRMVPIRYAEDMERSRDAWRECARDLAAALSDKARPHIESICEHNERVSGGIRSDLDRRDLESVDKALTRFNNLNTDKQ